MTRKITIDIVKKEFMRRGYELLEDQYTNSKTLMKYKYLKHPDEIRKINYSNFYNGKGCNKCGVEKRSEKKKLSYNVIKQEFEKRGYKLLEKEYINAKTKLRYRCPNHPDKELSITYNNLKIGKGCFYCGIENTVKKQKHPFKFIKNEFEKEVMNYLTLFILMHIQK